ncbi:MAG: lamin tail domain-containing protein, partial [Thermoleophilaceae bacterium]
FENVDRPKGVGDGGYLFDRDGDLRSWTVYPCRYRCSDPLRGNVALTVQSSTPEAVEIGNGSSEQIDLEGYVVENDPWIYNFGPDTIVGPGETLRLLVQGAGRDDTRLVKHWGKSRSILNDGGDRVVLRTASNIRIACDAWASASC